jgi:3-methyladenine DNA glycosylase AlkD
MGAADTELVQTLRAVLAAAGDPDKAAPMQAYMKSAMPYRGIQSPTLRAVVRPLLDAHPLPDEETWHRTVLALWDGAEFREERYAALALAKHRRYREHQQVHTLSLYEHLIRTGAWWDLVDDVAGHLVRDLLLAHREQATPVLRGWASADDLWVRRAAVICQLGTRDRCDHELLAHAIAENLDGSTRTTPARSPYGREFFVRKAIGWALRDQARTDPGWVLDVLQEHGDDLSGLTRREALKHLPTSTASGAAQP